jgi:anti-sigma regulatory factor (Ser/Thr protein kinase)
VTPADDPPQIRLQLSTSSRPDAVRRARRALETFEELQADEQRAFDVRLLVSELVGNAVTHGAADGASERVELVASLHRHRLHVEVSDGGAGFILGDRSAPPGPEATSGRGLFLLRTLADRYGVGDEQGGGHVWFEVDLPSEGPQTA